MARSQMTPQAHGKLIAFYGRFGEAVKFRSRLRIHRAHDAVEGMEGVLTRADSWHYHANENAKPKGTENGKARNH